MAEKDVVTFLEEWQTGAFLILGSAFVGVVFGSALGSAWSGFYGVTGFFVSAVLAFLLFSYVLYGR